MASQRRLFDSEPPASPPPPPAARIDALIQRPQRQQSELPILTLDDRIPHEHPVRSVEAVLSGLDLGLLLARIGANAERGGRPAIDPRILLTLWVYGTIEGIAHASDLARRVQTDDVFRWICGGVLVGERKLAAFRASGGEVFSALLTQVLTALMSEGLIDLHRTAQDGTRVRAWCGADSFRRQETLDRLMSEAKEHLRILEEQAHNPRVSAVQRAAQKRGAQERIERLSRALDRARKLAAGLTEEERKDPKKAPRVSSTDPEATRMKMADGGTRPAFNVQFETVADGTGAIAGVSASNRGNDFGEMSAMSEQVHERTGQRPAEKLVDGGYVQKEDIRRMERKGTQVFAPVPKQQARPGGRTERERSAEERAFHERIQSEEGKAVYAKRGEVAELTNAHAKSRFGMTSLMLRGLKGALTVGVLVALTQNVQVLIRERSREAPTAKGSAGIRG